MTTPPIIDPNASTVTIDLSRACRDLGFFYLVNHGIDPKLQRRLETLSRAFFEQNHDTKMEIAMPLAGKAWRGYFPVGNELTSGYADRKEGIYFGAELPANDPRVVAQIPLHGANLFPKSPSELKDVVLEYIAVMTELGHKVTSLLALSLGLEASYFLDRYTRDPLVLFRIFNYPPGNADDWGVGEHSDYGFITLLKQDDCGGLEVKTRTGWMDAPPIPNAFVCNIGDMLDRMTAGRYRSTPHRVRNRSGRARLSFPFFFDPNWNAQIQPLPTNPAASQPDDKHHRWDRASVHEFQGTYGEYILKKVSKVFPALSTSVIASEAKQSHSTE